MDCTIGPGYNNPPICKAIIKILKLKCNKIFDFLHILAISIVLIGDFSWPNLKICADLRNGNVPKKG